jgi:hypothetical protein
MDIKKIGPWLQIAGNLAVLAGIALLAVEINQNSLLVRAQLESEMNAGWIDIDASKQSETFAETLATAIDAPEELTTTQMVELDGYLFTYMDQLARHLSRVALGLEEQPLADLVENSIDDFFGNRYAHAWWAETRHKWGGLRAEIDLHLERVSVDQDLEYYGRIRARLQEGR